MPVHPPAHMPALFVDHLTVMDFTYLDQERGLVGESWIVDVVLQGALDEQGMVFDFGDVKKQIKRAIDESFDHKFVVPAQLPGLERDEQNQSLILRWTDTRGRQWQHSSPPDAVVLLPGDTITREAATRWLIDLLRRFVPVNVDAIKVNLRTEAIDGAYYHYSHGLKKHLGNCQRIAHGHRSRLEVFVDDKRAPEIEQQWAERWRDIYLGTVEDMVEQYRDNQQDYVGFAYRSCQGDFSLTLPADKVYFIEYDSTVELLADHLAQEIAASHPGHTIAVKAFEGVWKGAIARR